MGLGLLVLLAGAHIANDGLASTLAALLPTLREVHQLSATGLALLVAALSFSSSVTQPLWGRWQTGSAPASWQPPGWRPVQY